MYRADILGALDVDDSNAVSELALIERDKIADTSIALAKEMQFSSEASASANSRSWTCIASNLSPDAKSLRRGVPIVAAQWGLWIHIA